jgi:flagellum-specific ATP synthase
MSVLDPYRQILRRVQPVGITGRVRAARGLTVSVAGFAAPIGAPCRIIRDGRCVQASVIGFAGQETLVMPMGDVTGIRRGDRVVCSANDETLGVSPGMLGRVLDGLGRPADDGAEIRPDRRMPLWPAPLGPLGRRRITEPLATGVRAIDAMLTVGRGQRMGIFSGSGVGKSVLLGMIGRYTAADVTVIALIGERAREVREFVERDLGPDGLRRAVVVASTGEDSPLLQIRCGAVAAAVAEYFRDQGCHVLLLMDSLTRLAMAQRQIGLAAGEPPATKGYTPSVFHLLPRLLERSGRAAAGGSITGFYTVLVEGDNMADPVGDAARAVTAGHIHLSRALANRGHFPAIDVLQSVSRVMADVVDEPHLLAARKLQSLLATYAEVEDMVHVGAYRKGTSGEHDLAIHMMPALRQFLVQGRDRGWDFATTRSALMGLNDQLRTAGRQIARKATAPAATRAPAASTVGGR